MVGHQPPYVEHACIPDIFASGMALAEDIGEGNYRFTFYVNHRSVHDGTREREIVCRIVLPALAVHSAIQMALEGMGVLPVPPCKVCPKQVAH